jgi:hypothetical protein
MGEPDSGVVVGRRKRQPRIGVSVVQRIGLKGRSQRFAAVLALAALIVLATASVAFAGDNILGADPLPTPATFNTPSLDATAGPTDQVYSVYLDVGDAFYASANDGYDNVFYLFPPGSTDVTTDFYVDAVEDTGPQDMYYKATTAGTYYFDVYSPPGAPAGIMSIYAGIEKPSSLTISGATNQVVPFMSDLSIGGTLRNGLGQPLAGEMVTVLRQYPGGKLEKISTLWTDDTGYCAYTDFMNGALTRATYTLHFEGLRPNETTGFGLQMATAQKTISPYAYMSGVASASTVTHGRAFALSTFLLPRHASGSVAGTLYCYRLEGKVYKLRKTVSLKASNTTYQSTKYPGVLASKIGASVVLPYAGKWKVRILHSDASHQATYTAYKAIIAK